MYRPLAFIALLLTLVVAACGGGTEPAAVVNDKEITVRELDTRVQITLEQYQQFGIDVGSQEVKDAVRQETLREMINELLLLEHGLAQGITAESAVFQQEYATLRARFQSEEALQEAMRSEGVSREELNHIIIQQIVLFEAVGSRVDAEPISDDEVRELYDYYAAGAPDIPPYDEVSAMLREEIRAELWQIVAAEFIEELRAAANIEILL